MDPRPTISQLVAPEFERIRREMLDHGAEAGNPLTLKQDAPRSGAVYVLLDHDLRSPYVRVNIADKPNLLPQDSEPSEYPPPRFFDPIHDDSGFLGWAERGSVGSSMSGAEIVVVILELVNSA